MEREEKETFVSSLRTALESAEVVIVTSQTGLTVAQTTTLRSQMREAGASFKVAKNTLARLAVKVLDCEVITDHLTGPTAIAYSADPVAAAKIIAAFAKGNDKMKILGGSFKGKALSAADVQQLASLPSLDELRGKLIGLIQAPAGKIARLAQEPAAQLARLCSAYGQKA